jgi:carbamoyl-phosphate synthase large subunit
VANRDKRAIVLAARRLTELGFRLLATRGTAAVLSRAGIPADAVRKRSEGSPNAPELIAAGEIDLVVNTPFGRGPRTDGYFIRTAAAAAGIPCITTMQGLGMAVQGIEAMLAGDQAVRSLQEFQRDAAAEPPPRRRLAVSPVASPAAGGGV